MTARDAIVARAILPVVDMGAAIAFYRSLGFTVTSYDDGYAWVTDGGEEVFHLRLDVDLNPLDNRSMLYLHVGDVDRRHAQWATEGAGALENMPWGMREFRLSDPSGNVLRVGANL